MTWAHDDDDLVQSIAQMLGIPIESVSDDVLDIAVWRCPADEHLAALQAEFDTQRLYQTALMLLPENLPPSDPWARRREVLRLAWEKNMTQQEIATTLNCHPGTIIKDKKVLKAFIKRIECIYLQIRNALPHPQQTLLRFAVVYEASMENIARYAHDYLGMEEADCLHQFQRIRQDFIQLLHKEL